MSEPKKTREERNAALCRHGRAFESLREHPGWKFILDWLTAEEVRLGQRLLRNTDPEDVTSIARVQGERAGLARLVDHVSKTIRDYQELLADDRREEEDPT